MHVQRLSTARTKVSVMLGLPIAQYERLAGKMGYSNGPKIDPVPQQGKILTTCAC